MSRLRVGVSSTRMSRSRAVEASLPSRTAQHQRTQKKAMPGPTVQQAFLQPPILQRLTTPAAYTAQTAALPKIKPLFPVHESAPIQMVRGKQVANVLTLGLRKLIVHLYRQHARRAQQAQQGQPVQQPPEPQQPPFRHADAYYATVMRHHTREHNIASIASHGLLNYDDRVKEFGEDVPGMSSIGGARGDFAGDEKKGVFFGPKEFVKRNKSTLSPTGVRVALPPGRTNKPVPLGDFERTNPEDEQLYWDRRFPGAMVTPKSIGADFIWSGKFKDLAQSEDATAQRKLQTICHAIAQQYPDPKPTWEEVLQNHLAAIDQGEVSDEEGDND